MSRFLHSKYKSLIPYDTSEEIESMNGYIKLNTNESPFEPSPRAAEYAAQAVRTLNFYPDPECRTLTEKLAFLLDIKPSEIVWGNGSDEILNFIFMALCENGAVFPNITYSFYKILADFHKVDYVAVSLRDFRISPDDFSDMKGRTIFIANPNAPTGLALTLEELRQIVKTNPESLIVIDEAYVDFGTQSAKNFIHEFNNVIVTRTFSKSRSMAGARLGWAMACEELSQDLRNVKNTITPYNIDAMTQAAGLAALEDEEYTLKNINLICRVREETKKTLRELGFEVLDSVTNFLFARHERISGTEIFESLKREKIMIRHFNNPEIRDYNRITIGTAEQMKLMLQALERIVNR